MTTDTLTTYRHGEMIELPEPDWYVRANQLGVADGLDWHESLSKVLRSSRGSEGMERALSDGAAFFYWVIRDGGGHYAEFCTGDDIVEGVWIPEEADWLPFRTQHVMPFLQAHAAVALTNRLELVLQHCGITPGPWQPQRQSRWPSGGAPALPESLLKAAAAARRMAS